MLSQSKQSDSEAKVIAPRRRARRKPQEFPDYDKQGYLRFVAAYPKVDEADTVRAWDAMQPTAEEQEAIHADIQRRLPEWTAKQGEFVKAPGPYLRGRKWKEFNRLAAGCSSLLTSTQPAVTFVTREFVSDFNEDGSRKDGKEFKPLPAGQPRQYRPMKQG